MNRQLSHWREASYKEMSRLLTRLRADYDGLRMANKTRQRAVADSTAEMARLEVVAAGETERAKADKELGDAAGGKDAAAEAARQLLEAQERRRLTLQHMVARLKQQRGELDTGVENLQRDLELLRRQRSEARLSLQTTRTERKHALALAERLRAQLEADRAQREGKMAAMEAALVEQGERRRAFDERERRRLNIAHLPRGDLDEAGEDRLKQLFVVRRIYASMLARRLREDARRCDRLQAAFQRIRGATGLTDTKEIVAKFLDRDGAVGALRSQLQAARDRLEAARATRQQASWRLDQVAAAAGGGSGRKRAQYVNKDAFRRRRTDAARRCAERRSRVERLTVMLEDCRACVAKLLTRLGIPVVAEVAKVDLRGARAGPRDAADTSNVAAAILATARSAAASSRLPAGSGVAGARAMRTGDEELAEPDRAGSRRRSADMSGRAASPMGAGGFDDVAGASNRSGAAPSPARSHAAAEAGRRQGDGPVAEPAGVGAAQGASQPGAVRVTLQTLDSALGQVETAVARGLAQLAAAMERDEVRATRLPAGRTLTPGAGTARSASSPLQADSTEPEAEDASNVRVAARVRERRGAPSPEPSVEADPRAVTGSASASAARLGAEADGGGAAGATRSQAEVLSAADLRRLHRMLAARSGSGGVPVGGLASIHVGGGAGAYGDDDDDDDDDEDLFTRTDIKRVSGMLVGQASSATEGAARGGGGGRGRAGRSLQQQQQQQQQLGMGSSGRGGKGAKRAGQTGPSASELRALQEAEAAAAPVLGFVGPVATPRPHDNPRVIITAEEAKMRSTAVAAAAAAAAATKDGKPHPPAHGRDDAARDIDSESARGSASAFSTEAGTRSGRAGTRLA
ncbi:hypothetical protein FNF31_00799 [Cafeteria roenbergensis]|uniref:Uncharacterized protein n=2 Tax=Cafeteria roenbergensis TaxID=33653 RepID=A0A5A8DT51_CAFRO|nr:hypothetical protein FNF31_00799 [Cafeteria roenbergensis]